MNITLFRVHYLFVDSITPVFSTCVMQGELINISHFPPSIVLWVIRTGLKFIHAIQLFVWKVLSLLLCNHWRNADPYSRIIYNMTIFRTNTDLSIFR